MNKIVLKVAGMMCQGCEKRICNALNDLAGVHSVKASYKKGRVMLKTDELVKIEDIENRIVDLGFTIEEEN